MNTEKLTHVATFYSLILLKQKYQCWYLYQLSVIWYFQNRSWVVFSSDEKLDKAKKYFFILKKMKKSKFMSKLVVFTQYQFWHTLNGHIKTERSLYFTYWEIFFRKSFSPVFWLEHNQRKSSPNFCIRPEQKKIFFLFTSKE